MCVCTITVHVQVVSVSLTVETRLEESQPGCLIEGRNIILTCNIIEGYPRPVITFKKRGENIVPTSFEFFRITQLNFNQVYTYKVEPMGPD